MEKKAIHVWEILMVIFRIYQYKIRIISAKLYILRKLFGVGIETPAIG
jgi:hypothetical protein